MNQWKSINDGIPEPEVFVLCWNGREVFVDWWGSLKDNGNGATHWAYFDAPPGLSGMYRNPNRKIGADMSKDALMKYDPTNGNPNPYPSHAKQYREYHGKIAWLVNPWTGDGRDPRDIGTDVFGILIEPPKE